LIAVQLRWSLSFVLNDFKLEFVDDVAVSDTSGRITGRYFSSLSASLVWAKKAT